MDFANQLALEGLDRRQAVLDAAGRSLGMDSYLEQTETVKKVPALRYLLG